MNTDQIIVPDALALRGLSDGLKASIIAIYRDLARGSYLLGQHDLVETCTRNADALEHGGVLDLSEVTP